MWLATLLEVFPSFALFRGLWEMSQYAFLAASNGGDGEALRGRTKSGTQAYRWHS